MRFTLQMKYLVLHFLVRTGDKFLEVVLAINLGWCCEEKDLINQKLIGPHILAHETHIWLITLLLSSQVLFCFLLLLYFKSRSWEIITSRLYMNFQTLSNLLFRQLLNFFKTNHIDLRDTSGSKQTSVSVYMSRLVLMFRKASNNHF